MAGVTRSSFEWRFRANYTTLSTPQAVGESLFQPKHLHSLTSL